MPKSRTQVALVTGASSGIGFNVSKQLAAKGYKVYACARRTEPIEPLSKEFPGLIIPTKLDISKELEILELKKRLSEDLPEGKLDILYNNAGQSCTYPALDVSNIAMEQCFQVNVFGHINLCRELSQFLINSQGTIVFTGSLAGIISFPFGSIYSATKAAIHAYARGLHLELKPFNVRVINVVTGGVDTNIADTRPLPESSIYNFPAGLEAFQGRQKMAKNNHPISAEIYAKQVLDVVFSKKDPVDLYRGTMSTFLRYVAQFVPYSILEYGLVAKFKLGKVFEVLKTKTKQE
ncbi:hypothetical protein TPHA_0F01320 [Tetrapisispora phaffii CBS 4417]|uniref:NADPH-dependent 1-acyldihydroxyacetone phosphate reductase n=1 Tax=Tetrapisispora phaffii (strain ATCC 24235 / CBS 4417 / NBRC 1672 / NRRL Y-8282 / UCD 70-5) TaxID=1071381 RepID=G8BV35_TETPH|nr:hypothetical protein TPHA_0F01320 [Tetrapisispora phaffii CBS 4417]CCE63617.1 hypothetical protein TPHA_0F01320 [Tetrapisispora phaffii CBS 4417]